MLPILILSLSLVPATPIMVGYSAEMASAEFTGVLHDNISNRARQGSGFNPLCIRDYPAYSIFRDGEVGLNFEHVFNGTLADKALCMFTPRKDRNTLEVHAPDKVTLHWPAEHSSWNMECHMTYTLVEDGVEMAFRARPMRDRFPLGYCVFMWASYMHRTRERAYQFYGQQDGREQWLAFGEDLREGGFETGTIACAGVAPLRYEEGAQTLNLVENPSKSFIKPFYYGIIDGDGDLETDNDTLVYIMMFDQREPIRFALWNFIADKNKKPDPHSPAWDWQYVIWNPEIGKEYGYRAKLVVKPWRGREDVEASYDGWK